MLKSTLPEPRSLKQGELFRFVAKAGLVDLDTLVDRFFREQHETLLEARPRAKQALQRLLVQEYLQVRPVVMDGARALDTKRVGDLARFATHYTQLAYCITPRAARDFNQPLPPTLRENFVEHTLKTTRAITEIEKRMRWGEEPLLGRGRVVDFAMESELIRENFRGKVFRPHTQQIVPMFPDAQLVVEREGGVRERVNVEYVSAKYTDEMIREKARSFSGPTVWAVPNASTAARVQAITGSTALIV